jgi:hypothetical protein
MNEGWLVCWPSGQEFQVVPIGDDSEHFDEDCPCQPRTEVVWHEDGSFAAFQVSHNAWDGRE